MKIKGMSGEEYSVTGQGQGPLVLRLSLDLMLEVSLAVAETDVTQVTRAQ